MTILSTLKEKLLGVKILRDLIIKHGKFPSAIEIQQERSKYNVYNVYKYTPHPEISSNEKYNEDFENIKLDLDLATKDIYIQINKSIQHLIYSLTQSYNLRNRMSKIKKSAIEGINKKKKEVIEYHIESDAAPTSTTDRDPIIPASMISTKESKKIIPKSKISIDTQLDESGQRKNVFIDEFDKTWSGMLESNDQTAKTITLNISIEPTRMNKITLETVGSYAVEVGINGNKIYNNRREISKHIVRFNTEEITDISISLTNNYFETIKDVYRFYWSIRNINFELSKLSNTSTYYSPSISLGVDADTIKLIPSLGGYDDIKFTGTVGFDSGDDLTISLPPNEGVFLNNTTEVSETISKGSSGSTYAVSFISADSFANKPLIKLTPTSIIDSSTRIIRGLNYFTYKSFRYEKLDDRFKPTITNWIQEKANIEVDHLSKGESARFSRTIYDETVQANQPQISINGIEQYEYGMLTGYIYAQKSINGSLRVRTNGSVSANATIAIYVNGTLIKYGGVTSDSDNISGEFELKTNQWNSINIIVYNFDSSINIVVESDDNNAEYIGTSEYMKRGNTPIEMKRTDIMSVMMSNDMNIYAEYDGNIYMNLSTDNFRSNTLQLEGDLLLKGKASSRQPQTIEVSAVMNSDKNRNLSPMLYDFAVEASIETSYPIERL